MSAVLTAVAGSLIVSYVTSKVFPEVAKLIGRLLLTPVGKYLGLLGLSAIAVEIFLSRDSDYEYSDLGVSAAVAAVLWVVL